MRTHSGIDYFIYGHRHIELDLMLSKTTRMMILGDWIWQFTYASSTVSICLWSNTLRERRNSEPFSKKIGGRHFTF